MFTRNKVAVFPLRKKSAILFASYTSLLCRYPRLAEGRINLRFNLASNLQWYYLYGNITFCVRSLYIADKFKAAIRARIAGPANPRVARIVSKWKLIRKDPALCSRWKDCRNSYCRDPREAARICSFDGSKRRRNSRHFLARAPRGLADPPYRDKSPITMPDGPHGGNESDAMVVSTMMHHLIVWRFEFYIRSP